MTRETRRQSRKINGASSHSILSSHQFPQSVTHPYSTTPAVAATNLDPLLRCTFLHMVRLHGQVRTREKDHRHGPRLVTELTDCLMSWSPCIVYARSLSCLLVLIFPSCFLLLPASWYLHAGTGTHVPRSAGAPRPITYKQRTVTVVVSVLAVRTVHVHPLV